LKELVYFIAFSSMFIANFNWFRMKNGIFQHSIRTRT